MFSGIEDHAADPSKKGAKTTINLEKGAQRRTTAAVKLRKDRRDEELSQKRRGGGAEETHVVEPSASGDVWAYTELSKPTTIPVELLPQFAALVRSADPRCQLHGTMMIRKLLSVEKGPPIEEVISTNVCPILVQFLARSELPKLQFEAAWALTNVASGLPQHTTYVLSINAAPYLVQLLQSPDDNCKEQATWALGNLAGDNAKCRDYILSLNVVEPLLHVLSQPTELIGVHRNATWALSNLCRSKPPPELELIAPAIPMFVSQLTHTDDEIVMDAAWAISYISDGSNERVQRILTYNPVPQLVRLLASSASSLSTPAIRTIGNICTGSDAQTQIVINAGALNNFTFLLNHAKRGIRKEVCWTLSNITAGTKEQITQVLAAGLLPPLLECMFAVEFEVKKEAVWAIANLTCGASKEHIQYLVQIGGLDNLCELLGQFDSKIIAVALEAIENILGFGEAIRKDHNLHENPYAAQLMKNGGLDKLELLHTSSHQEVWSRTNNLLSSYFEGEDLQDGVGAPAEVPTVHTSSGLGFQFQAQARPTTGFTFDQQRPSFQ